AAGRAPGGQREWYGVDDYRPIIDGSLQIDGRDAGRLAALPQDLGVGMSAFPALPAVVHLCALVDADGPAPR
ncbi:MAG TPA: hypothetical protein VG452_08955, partial [Egibacteraceae bacterium]|nr:hypothetical protein [Egibacteraceae bacterium]